LSRSYVLDAGFIALYFAGREDTRKYVDEIYKGISKAYICEVNLAEFLYNYSRVFGWEAALVKNKLLRNSPIEIVGVGEDLTLSAAKIKLKNYEKLSLADCYLVALAEKLKATILTTDPTLRNVEKIKVKYFKI